MENAVKALEMAAGVLLGVILMAAVAYFFTQISTWPENEDDLASSEQLAKFNQEYEVYNKSKMYGVDVLSCLNKVISNNADKYENDTYTWNINDNNKNINLEIDTSTVVNEINDSNSKLNIKIDAKVIITILIIIISLGLIFVLITLNKIRKANKI